ncbi:E3 ubiquitin-protein ligase Praja-2 [Polyrhizophydium stewartii]|uniref:E3 ubiquitin-protein ligase Praja-2 n=1 Tax=Polyrhizophydium stewartii TaxID=2732419 RepID=A0ABR4NCY1_9FUNG
MDLLPLMFGQLMNPAMSGPVSSENPLAQGRSRPPMPETSDPSQSSRRQGASSAAADGAEGSDEAPGSRSSANLQQYMMMAMLQQLGVMLGGESNILEILGDPGDYVSNQRSFDEIITRLMEQHAQGQHPPAASETTIRTLPHRPFKREGALHVECIVCQEDFAEEETTIELPCKHVFHPECINNWLKLNGTCPVCRFSLVDQPASGASPS